MFRSYDDHPLETCSSSPVFTGSRPLLLVPFAMAVLIVVFPAAISKAVWSTSDSFQSNESIESDEYPGAGLITRYETLNLWLPDALRDLPGLQARGEIMRDHESFRRFLERQDGESCRFAVTYRAHQVNGAWSDITFIRRPHDEPDHFHELAAALAALGPEQGASVHIVAEELLNREPAAMLAEMRRIVD